MSEYLYQFAVLRYIHDPVTEEFLNVGVVLYAPEAHFLQAIINPNYGRLSHAFQKVNGDFYRKVARALESHINQFSQQLRQGHLLDPLPRQLEQLLARMLPPDDSSFAFRGYGSGIGENLEQELQSLYQRLVVRYAEAPEVSSRDDAQVWRTYLNEFSKHDIVSHLSTVTIHTPTIDHEFGHAWKNERWHPVEPLSFDLVQPRSITDKASRWIGHARSLAQSDALGTIYMLLGAPKEAALVDAYQKAIVRIKQETDNVEVVEEKDASAFSERFATIIKEHEHSS